MPLIRSSIAILALTLAALPAWAQSAPPNFLQEFERQFESSATKLVALAEAMPAETYGWSPGEGVASVARVYMHIARYNYMYPDQSLGIGAPADRADYAAWEDAVTEKDAVLDRLRASMDHVRRVAGGMQADDLGQVTTLYGREVGRWAVLLQLIAHMNEHLGQAIAYARTNDVVPPWSR